jgi:demethylmenaquinone methyltransferase / 2-methoxy-6-polyprenyl-1,4-benzoquinol methylase
VNSPAKRQSSSESAAGTAREVDPGTRPAGTQDEAAASRYVRDMFGRIAPKYDFLNHLLSLSLDKTWRRKTAKRFRQILRKPESRMLDLCCGTGDLAFALDRERGPVLQWGSEKTGFILGADFSQPMLALALEKARVVNAGAKFLAADSLVLPFPDSSFDLITVAFGFRNLANYQAGLREIFRVLRRGGEAGILEFSEPRSGPMAPVYRFYFRRILPRIGGAISGNANAYGYLPASVAKFPEPEELARWMRQAGFSTVEFSPWTFGAVTLHTGRRL